MHARRIAAATVGRSDYGIYVPVLRALQQDTAVDLHLIAAGTHLAGAFGLTIRQIEADGFRVDERVETVLPADTPEAITRSMALAVQGFGRAYARLRPDLLLVLADRFEMHAAALAALPFHIPVAHLHGGELTEGAMDDALRHGITKLSHLHFVATETYARRVVQLGEEPWRVIVTGSPALDHLQSFRRLASAELERQFGLDLRTPPLLVTFHPVTLEYEQTEWQMGELLAALRAVEFPLIFTLPNGDTHGRRIIAMLESFVSETLRARLVANFGTQGYFSMMAHAAAMVGNSSSGITEAPSLGLPVVNIGTRQQGRLRAANVIDVGYRRDEIVAGIRQATDQVFRAGLRGLQNPYGDGHAAAIIVRHLREIPLDRRLLMKSFHDLPVATEATVP